MTRHYCVKITNVYKFYKVVHLFHYINQKNVDINILWQYRTNLVNIVVITETVKLLGKMISEEDEEFVRISLLLLKGGGLISKEALYSKIKATNTPIDVLLKSFKDQLKHQFHKKQLRKLIPDVGHTNVEEWDVQMITGTLLTVFDSSLTHDENKAIASIKYVRNEIYAHRSVSSLLSKSEYDDIRTELENAIKTLSSTMDKVEKDKFERIIEECSEWRINSRSVETLCQGVIKSEELLDDILEKLREYTDDLKEEMDAQHERTRKEIIEKIENIFRDEERNIKSILVVLGLELTLKGDKNNPELVRKAEEILTKVFNSAIKKAGNSDQMQVFEAVKELLDELDKISGVEMLPVKPNCILLQFVCKSYLGLHKLLLYLESDDFRQHLQKIVGAFKEVEELKASSYSLTSRVIPKSLKEVLRIITDIETESTYLRSIELPVEVSTHDGRDQVKNLFGSETTRKIVNKISDSISSVVGADITIKPSVNVKQEKVTTGPIKSNFQETVENAGPVSKINVPDIALYREGIDGTNELFRSLTLVKSEPCNPLSDSGRGDSVSYKTGKSSVYSDRSSETYDEDNRSDNNDRPRKKIKLEDRPAVTIGMAVNLRRSDDSCIVETSSIGPFVSVVGTNAVTFITVGVQKNVLETAFLQDCKRNAKTIVRNPKDDTILVEVIDDRNSSLQDKDINTDIKLDKERLSEGAFVYKIGVSGLTEGIIQGAGTIPGSRTFNDKQEIMYVASLSGFSGKPFADHGDAGAAVFSHDEDSWACIGVLLGVQKDLHSNEDLYVVKLIDDVIKEMQDISGKKISLDQRAMNSQISKAFEML